MSSPDPPDPEAGARERRRITGRAGIVALGTLFSRVLGLGREVVLAAVFPRVVTDAFWVAFTIPNVFRQLLAEGATQTAVLPVLARVREQQGEAAAQRFFRAARGLSLLVLGAVTVLGVLGAPWLVTAFAPGFGAAHGLRERTIELTRWCFPYLFFMGSAALGMVALHVHQRFVAASFAPALQNVAFIAFALGFPLLAASRGADPMVALGLAVLVGGALQVVAQWPSLRAIGYLGRPSLELGHPDLREALRRMVPALFGIGVYLVDVMVARGLLSTLGVGAQSWFGWAMRLCDFPQGIFVMALQTATLPSLSIIAARGDRDELGRTFAFGLGLALFVAIPASVLFVALSEPLVVAFFERGAFDAESSRETGRSLAAQALGIWAVAASRQVLAVFFAVGDTRTPVLVAAADFLVFLALALGLRGSLGHVGVALAVAGSATVQFLLLALLVRRHARLDAPGALFGSVGRTLLASLAAAGAARALLPALRELAGTGPVGRMVPGLVGAALFGIVFLGAAWLLRSPELRGMTDGLRRRLARG